MSDEKNMVHFEYSVLFTEFKRMESNVSVIVNEVDKSSKVKNTVGTFNFRFFSKDQYEIDELIKEKIRDMLKFKLMNQERINTDFKSIIKSFQNKT